LECSLEDTRATFRVRDWGTWRTPTDDPDSRGIMLMRRLADAFELRHLSDGTEVVLTFAVRRLAE
jgi:hypothetical protein